jgi:NAD(P) transhydrogenase subunit alpha
MGAGVAGLQAIATAKRLGAVVTATDVRAAAGEQVESLGAKFIMTDALKDASGTGGYARELTKDEQAAQAELVAGHIAKQDIVITTALIPGRPAPKLVTKAMVESMAPGSVLVDLAAERGGNIELTQPGKTITTANGATIIGFTNVAGRLATSASQLYSRNLVSFLETLVDKKEKVLAVNWDDELVKATVLTRDGAIVHPNIKVDAAPVAAKPAAAKAAEPKKAAAPKAEVAPATPAKAAVAKPVGGKVKKAAPIVAPVAKAAAPEKAAAPKKAAAKPVATKPATAKPAAKPSTAKGKK